MQGEAPLPGAQFDRLVVVELQAHADALEASLSVPQPKVEPVPARGRSSAPRWADAQSESELAAVARTASSKSRNPDFPSSLDNRLRFPPLRRARSLSGRTSLVRVKFLSPGAEFSLRQEQQWRRFSNLAARQLPPPEDLLQVPVEEKARPAGGLAAPPSFASACSQPAVARASAPVPVQPVQDQALPAQGSSGDVPMGVPPVADPPAPLTWAELVSACSGEVPAGRIVANLRTRQSTLWKQLRLQQIPVEQFA